MRSRILKKKNNNNIEEGINKGLKMSLLQSTEDINESRLLLRLSLRHRKNKVLFLLMICISYVFLTIADRFSKNLLSFSLSPLNFHSKSQSLVNYKSDIDIFEAARERLEGSGAQADAYCRRLWFKTGDHCDSPFISRPLDVLWTWRNGSEIQQDHLYEMVINSDPGLKPRDTLRFSMRSAQKHFTKGFGKIALLSPDFMAEGQTFSYNLVKRTEQVENALQKSAEFLKTNFKQIKSSFSDDSGTLNAIQEPIESRYANKSLQPFYDEFGLLRYGQQPSWLQSPSQASFYEPITLLYHWNVACSTISSRKENSRKSVAGANSWERLSSYTCKRKSLPTLNELRMDMIASETSTLSKTFLRIGQDTFFASDVSASDFYTPLYGPIFHLGAMGISSDPKRLPEGAAFNGMQVSNALLGARFGFKDRPMVMPLPNVISQHIVDEVKRMWSQEWSNAMSSGEESKGLFNSQFLLSHFLMERYREALLWSFIIAKHDVNADDEFSSHEIKAMFSDLGADFDAIMNKGQSKQVFYPKRKTLSEERYYKNLQVRNLPRPNSFIPSFTSLDGHYASLANIKPKGSSNIWPNFDSTTWKKEDEQLVACELQPICFEPLRSKDGQKPSVTSFFRHVSSAYWGCGDCMITLLTGASGEQGLKAFLPASDLRMPSPKQRLSPLGHPFLPLTRYADMASFSLQAVASSSGLADTNRLNLVTYLLNRYKYSLVESNLNTIPVMEDTIPSRLSLSQLEVESPKVFTIFDNTTLNSQNDAKDLIWAWLNIRYPISIPSEG